MTSLSSAVVGAVVGVVGGVVVGFNVQNLNMHPSGFNVQNAEGKTVEVTANWQFDNTFGDPVPPSFEPGTEIRFFLHADGYKKISICCVYPSCVESFYRCKDEYYNEDREVLLQRHKFQRWRADFEKWGELDDDDFRSFKALLLKNSSRIHLRVKNKNQDYRIYRIGNFSKNDYDNFKKFKNIERELAEGKAGLLNIYARMKKEDTPWWNDIEELLVIQRDRIIGIISHHGAEKIVKIIEDDDQDYRRVDVGIGHQKNIKSGLKVILQDESEIKNGDFVYHSIKTDGEKGVLQLTIGHFIPASEDDKDYWILDVDIDENGNCIEHFKDFIKHQFTRGTHPFHIYDILHYQERKRLKQGTSLLRLGYSLSLNLDG